MYESLLNPAHFLAQIAFFIVLWLFFELVSFIFPAFRRLLVVLFLPFHYLHAYTHFYVAHRLNYLETYLPAHSRSGSFPLLRIALDREDSTGAMIRASSTRAAYQIAIAPLKVGMVVLVLVLVSGQLVIGAKYVILDFTGGDVAGLLLVYLLHLYCLLGLTRLIPSFADYQYVLLVHMTRSQAAPIWLAWSLVVFTVTFTTELLTTQSVGSALVLGFLAMIVYLLAYIIMIGHFREPDLSVDWNEIQMIDEKQVRQQIQDSFYSQE